MNYIKRITIVLVLFIIIVIVISLFLPSSLHIERKIVINADQEQIFKQVNDLKNWKNWAPWALIDSSVYLLEESYSNPSYGVGATFKWNSENGDLGKGSIKIIKSKPYNAIENHLNIGMIEAKGTWVFNDTPDGIKVTWGMDIDFGFNPIAKFFGLFIEDQVSPDYELGLKRLKSFTENLPKIHRVEVKKITIKDNQWFLSIRDTVNQKEMNNIHGKNYAKINQFMDEKGIEINGAPLTIYHFWSDSIIDIEVGIPVKDSTIIGRDEIKLNKIKAGNVVTATHYGSYERLPETYFGINEWMRKNKVVVTGSPWESYLTDPATEPNPENWQTAIFFPIE